MAGDRIGSSSANKITLLPLKLCKAIALAAGKANMTDKIVTTEAIDKLLSKAVEIPDEESNK